MLLVTALDWTWYRYGEPQAGGRGVHGGGGLAVQAGAGPVSEQTADGTDHLQRPGLDRRQPDHVLHRLPAQAPLRL